MSSPAVVLLAHGSADARSRQAVELCAATVAARTGAVVRAAYLEQCEPDLATAVELLVGGPVERVVVLPLLLSRAFHARVDVPAAVEAAGARSPSIRVEALAPVGHPLDLLDAVVRDAGPRCVVVAAGTRVDEERELFADLVGAAGARTGTSAAAAFASGPGPEVADAVAGLTDDSIGAGDVEVVPWLLAPGVFTDRIRAQAREVGAVFTDVAGGLLARPELLAELCRRVSAPSGPATGGAVPRRS